MLEAFGTRTKRDDTLLIAELVFETRDISCIIYAQTCVEYFYAFIISRITSDRRDTFFWFLVSLDSAARTARNIAKLVSGISSRGGDNGSESDSADLSSDAIEHRVMKHS